MQQAINIHSPSMHINACASLHADVVQNVEVTLMTVHRSRSFGSRDGLCPGDQLETLLLARQSDHTRISGSVTGLGSCRPSHSVSKLKCVARYEDEVNEATHGDLW